MGEEIVTKICKGCNQEFIVTKKRLIRFKSEHDYLLYCSKECYLNQKSLNKSTFDYCKVFIRNCIICNKLYVGRTETTKTCSDNCRGKYDAKRSKDWNIARSWKWKKVFKCKACGNEYNPPYGIKRQSFCSEDCKTSYHSYIRRVLKKDNYAEIFDVKEIFMRDGWHCRHCGVRTPWSKRGKIVSDAPVLDHIIPVSLGGNHTWANVQLLCNRCNSKKGNRVFEGGEQLRII